MSIDLGTPPVVNGRTGEIIEAVVDGEPARIDMSQAPEEPKQLRLIDVPLESLVHDFNVLDRERDEVKAEIKRLKKVKTGLDERIDPILTELRRRDDEAQEPEQPSFEGIHAAAEEETYPDDEEPGD